MLGDRKKKHYLVGKEIEEILGMTTALVVADGHYYVDSEGNVFTENTHNYIFFLGI